MTHLGERITDFVFGELAPPEMDEARRHLAACADCRKEVEQFERTRSLLKMSPEVEPPRRIVFEFEKRKTNPIWQWLAPGAVAAAILIAVLLASQPHVQWNQSQLTISFGGAPAPAVVSPPAPVVEGVSAQQYDYDRILKEIERRLDKRDASQLKRIQRLQDQLVYLKAETSEFERVAIQTIAASGTQD